jgi:hypothetical protein
VKTTRLALGAVALTAIAASFATSAQAAPVGGPVARASQFAETPWACTPKKFSASGYSKKHTRYTGLPFAGGGTAFYKVSFDGQAVRCNGKTRISYHVYMNTAGFPGNRYVTYQLQSAGVHKKYKAACVKLYGSNKTRCTYKLEANKEIPIPGARPLYQYRGDGVIRYLRMVHVAEQDDGGGTNLAGKPQNIEIKLSAYKKQPKALW